MRTSPLLAGLLALALVSCTKEEVLPVDTPPYEPDDSGLEADPVAYRMNSVWGAITSRGQPLAGAFITVVHQDEKLPIAEHGEYVLLMEEDEYGKGPYRLLFSAPGHESQTHTVSVPDDGVELNVDLAPQ